MKNYQFCLLMSAIINLDSHSGMKWLGVGFVILGAIALYVEGFWKKN